MLLLTIKFMQQIYLKMWIHNNLIISARLFILLISSLILRVKNIVAIIKRILLYGTMPTPGLLKLLQPEDFLMWIN
jgi:hypothetical protein